MSRAVSIRLKARRPLVSSRNVTSVRDEAKGVNLGGLAKAINITVKHMQTTCFTGPQEGTVKVIMLDYRDGNPKLRFKVNKDDPVTGRTGLWERIHIGRPSDTPTGGFDWEGSSSADGKTCVLFGGGQGKTGMRKGAIKG